MLNQVILVGKVSNILEDEFELTVDRKDHGQDIIKVDMGTLQEAKGYIKNGFTVGVKARLKVEEGVISVIAEKMTFINHGE